MPPAWTQPAVDLLETQEVPKLGLCAFAAKDVEAGQAVLTEVPVLDAPLKSQLHALHEAELAAATEVQAGSLIPESICTVDVGLLDAFSASDEAVQKQVLSMQSTVDKESPICASVRKAVEMLKKVGPSLDMDAEVMEKVLLAGKVNAYLIGGGRQALFVRGRLIAHSCRPNCVFVAEHLATKDGAPLLCGSFRARQAIAKGELLTTSYIVEDMAAMFQEQRQHYIMCQKGFLCCCKACAEEDEFERWPCPSCRPRLEDGQLPGNQLAGCCVLRMNGRSPPWRSSCGKTFSDEDVQVKGWQTLAMEAMLSIHAPPANSKAATRNAMLGRVVQCFGEDHSVTQLLLRSGALRAVHALQPLEPMAERLIRCHEFLVSAGWPLGMMAFHSLYKALIARAQAEVKAKSPVSPSWFKLVTDSTNCAYIVEGPDSQTARTGLVITRLMATVALQEMQAE